MMAILNWIDHVLVHWHWLVHPVLVLVHLVLVLMHLVVVHLVLALVARLAQLVADLVYYHYPVLVAALVHWH